MEEDDKQKPHHHSSGHENHGGHVCHRCDWPFPNPHPSAKHRRAHKKHCGKIDGFRMTDEATVPPKERNDAAEASDEELSDEDRRMKPSKEQMPGELKPEAESSEKIEKGGCGADEGRGSGSPVIALEVGHLCIIDAAVEAKNSEKTGDTNAQNVVATSMIDDFTDVGDNVKTDAVMDVPTVSIIPGEFATDALEKDSESHKMDEHTEADVTSDVSNASGTEANILDEASVKMKAFDSKSSLRQGEQMDAAGQDSQDELISCTGSCPVEIIAREHLGASSDAIEVEYLTDMVDNCIVKGNLKENSTALSVLSNTPMGEISDMKHGLRKDHEPMESNVSLIYAVKEPDHLGDIALKLVPSEMISKKKLDQSEDAIPSSMQVFHKETGNGTEIDALNDNLSVGDEHNNAEGSPFVEHVECEADVSTVKFNVLDRLESDGLERHPHSTIRELSGSQAIDFVDPFTGSCEINVAPTQLEIEKECPFEGQDACHNLSNEVMSENHVEVADSDSAVLHSCEINVAPTQLEIERECPFEGQDTCHNLSNEVMSENHVEVADSDSAVSDAISPASEASKIINGNQVLVCEETGVTYNDVVGCCSQEISKVDSCQSDTEVDSEPRSQASESEVISDENKGKNEPERFKQLAASSVHDSVLGPEVMDIDSGHLAKSGPFSDKLNFQRVIEERTIEPAIGNDTDHPATQTEVQAKHVETESSLTKQPLEKLDHQKVQIKISKNISGVHPVETDDLQGTPIEPASGDNIDHLPEHTGIQIMHIETESSPEQPHEEPKLNESNEVGLCHHDAENFRLEEHTTLLVDLQTSAQISVTPDNFKTSDISEVDTSGTYDRSLQEGGDRVACRQLSDAALLVTDGSADSNSQTDSIEGLWGSVSDGAVLSSHVLSTQAIPAISNQTPKNLHASNLATEDAVAENSTDSIALFEAPSFMTLVEPAMQPASYEIQSMQNPQQSGGSPSQAQSHIVHESQGKKKNEITEKIIDWNSRKDHTPLKSLLAEAGFECKQKATNAHDHNTPLLTKKDRGSKMAPEHFNESSSNRAGHKEWNSPARLPVKKEAKRKKGKSAWVPFCCNYVS